LRRALTGCLFFRAGQVAFSPKGFDLFQAFAINLDKGTIVFSSWLNASNSRM
jgi:hypothetical protein